MTGRDADMPRLRKERSPYEGYVGLVMARRQADGRSWEELAAILHLSPTTLRSYIKNPEQMRLGTLRRLNRLLAIPAEDARAALPMW